MSRTQFYKFVSNETACHGLEDVTDAINEMSARCERAEKSVKDLEAMLHGQRETIAAQMWHNEKIIGDLTKEASSAIEQLKRVGWESDGQGGWKMSYVSTKSDMHGHHEVDSKPVDERPSAHELFDIMDKSQTISEMIVGALKRCGLVKP